MSGDEGTGASLLRDLDLDRAAPALGPSAAWPPALRQAVRVSLRSDRPVLVAWGADGFSFFNDAFLVACGSGCRGRLGRPLREVLPGAWPLLEPVVAQARAGTAQWLEQVPLSDGDGSDDRSPRRRFSVALAPLDIGDDGASGLLLTAHEVTESHRAQEALVEREEQLRLATEAADIGLWDVDVVHGTLYWPARVKAMFGISPDVPVSMDDFYAGLHPDDRDATTAAFAAACDPAERALYDVEYRTVGKEDQVLRHVAAKGRGIFDAAGRCTRVIGTAIDITVRKANEAALRHSEAQLLDSARRKDQFIATLAHELRNPLAALKAALHLVGMGQDISRFHELMSRQVNHLVRLVNDLMEVSRITTGSFELRREVVPVADVIAHAVETSGPDVKARRHALTVAPLPSPMHVEGDPVRLAQILSNLLSNAARFTPEGGRIEIATAASLGECVVTITDSGPGFTAERASRMFEMFNRSPESTGLGIGLSLSRRLAEMHGGTLEGRSAGPGHGAVFTLRLPLVAAPVPAAAAATPSDAARSVAVLVVDDNRDAANTTAELLRVANDDVRVAYDGFSALDACRARMPELAILDIGMPVMDGHALARRIRALDGGQAVLLVALSGWGQDEDRRRSREAGFDRHLVKPADLDGLLALVAHAASR